MGMAFDEGGAPTLEGGHTRAPRACTPGGDALGPGAAPVPRGGASSGTSGDRAASTAGPWRSTCATVRRPACAVEGGAVFTADRVVLATGGACGIYGRRTGPDTSLGEGIALAWHAGAALSDLEFVQFHPTALDMPGHPARLLTEALRGEGAVLRDARASASWNGSTRAASSRPATSWRARCRGCGRRRARPSCSTRPPVPDVARAVPRGRGAVRGGGLDIASDPVPVAPAAHYFTGGVLTDVGADTPVPGLLAAGEVACTGVHGANRLASNSLAEALVFGRRAAVAEPGVTPGSAPGTPSATCPRAPWRSRASGRAPTGS